MGRKTKHIKYCDRCKKEVVDLKGDIRYKNGAGIFNTFELCPDCNKAFLAWLFDVRLKGDK